MAKIMADLIGSVKEIAGLVKKVGDIERYREIIDVQGEVVEFSTQNL